MARRKLHKRAFGEIDRGTLGIFLFNARKRERLTQAQLAEVIGRDRPWLSDVETGKVTHVPDEDVHALATALSIAVDDLTRARDRVAIRARAAAPPQGSRQRRCPACDRSNPVDANYCANCGARLPSEIVCAGCQSGNPPDANYCAHCGRPMPGIAASLA